MPYSRNYEEKTASLSTVIGQANTYVYKQGVNCTLTSSDEITYSGNKTPESKQPSSETPQIELLLYRTLPKIYFQCKLKLY